MFKSKKLTFSLASFVMLVALALAPAALAAVDTLPVPTLSITDVSAVNGNQLELYQAVAPNAANTAALATQAGIDALLNTTPITGRNIEFYIRLEAGYALLDGRGAEQTPTDGTAGSVDELPMLHISDLAIKFYDIDGAAVSTADGIDLQGSKIEHRNTAFPDGRNFRVTIIQGDIPSTTTTGIARYMTVVLPGPVTEAAIKAAAALVPPVTLVASSIAKFQHADPVDVRTALIDGKALSWNATSNPLRFEIVNAEPTDGTPNVVSIVRAVTTAGRVTQQAGDSVFGGNPVNGPFDVRVTFTEEPNFVIDANNYKIADLPFQLENAKITSIIKGAPFYTAPAGIEGNYSQLNPPATPPTITGRDARYHSYLLTLTPDLINANDVVIRVDEFNDLVLPPNRYRPPSNTASVLNRSVLRVKVHLGAVSADIFKANTDALTAASAGGFLPAAQVIPANGYLVLVRNTAGSGVKAVSANKYKDDDDRARADNQTDIDFKYNVAEYTFPAADLANFFRNGGTISLGYTDLALADAQKTAINKLTGYHGSRSDADLLALDPPETIAAGSVVISEIMWGRNKGLVSDAPNSQWIELHNTTAADISIDASEWALTFGGAAFGTEIDSVSNLGPPYWAVPGSSGSTTSDVGVSISDIVSMSRVEAAGLGSDEKNWAASTDVGINLPFGYIGTPGVANRHAPVLLDEDDILVPDPTAPVATASDLRISEIMVSSNEGRLPQWIEITNDSTGEVSLDGWVVGIDNDSTDADVIAPSIGIKLDGVVLDASQTALVVSKMSNRNAGLDVVSDSGRIVDAQAQVNPPSATYSILSEMAFRISLEPPLEGGIADRGDLVGNLGGGWELLASEGARSSIIRREMGDAGEIMGTDAAGWVLASGTGNGGAYAATFYGDKDDIGTPGYDAGGALPVELSKFGAKRDPLTGQSIITWETQSELNNAGFFIKRSQQKDGKFEVINPTMVPGAGTVSEKQSYTYTDTTADPNIVYYYQIEDVSLDGNRQTLTRAHRLKGHVGAAGKATTTWGELKSSRD